MRITAFFCCDQIRPGEEHLMNITGAGRVFVPVLQIPVKGVLLFYLRCMASPTDKPGEYAFEVRLVNDDNLLSKCEGKFTTSEDDPIAYGNIALDARFPAVGGYTATFILGEESVGCPIKVQLVAQ
jgi:hypothetical protein